MQSGKPEGDLRYNELFINDGLLDTEDSIPTFKELAHQYGIADFGLSIHAAFFDYDKDKLGKKYSMNSKLLIVAMKDSLSFLTMTADY